MVVIDRCAPLPVWKPTMHTPCQRATILEVDIPTSGKQDLESPKIQFLVASNRSAENDESAIAAERRVKNRQGLPLACNRLNHSRTSS